MVTRIQQAAAPDPSRQVDALATVPGDSLETEWTAGYGRSIANQNRYNAELAAATARWPDLDPIVLKSMLAQESNFAPRVTNGFGYAGVAQLGVREAREHGLRTGGSRMRSRRLGRAAWIDPRDERLVPARAIPAAASLMGAKAATLDRGVRSRGVRLAGFETLGRPEGDDYWRFMAAAYNGGEGTVLWALRYAYGDARPPSVRWDDLVRAPGGDVRRAPLYRAAARVGLSPRAKYEEISTYARDVVRRARQDAPGGR